MLRTASAEVSAAISQQPASTFAGCSGAYQINQGVQPYTVNVERSRRRAPNTPPPFPRCPTGTPRHNQPNPCCCADRHMPHWSNRRGAAVADGLRAVQARWRRHAAARHNHECCRQPELGDGGVDLWYAGSTALGGATRQRQCRDGSLPTAHARDRGCQNICIEKTDASSVKLSVASGPGALKNCVPSLGQGETTFQDCTLSAPGQYTLIANDTDGAVHLTSHREQSIHHHTGLPRQTRSSPPVPVTEPVGCRSARSPSST